jgi:hypothetical protein
MFAEASGGKDSPLSGRHKGKTGGGLPTRRLLAAARMDFKEEVVIGSRHRS